MCMCISGYEFMHVDRQSFMYKHTHCIYEWIHTCVCVYVSQDE